MFGFSFCQASVFSSRHEGFLRRDTGPPGAPHRHSQGGQDATGDIEPPSPSGGGQRVGYPGARGGGAGRGPVAATALTFEVPRGFAGLSRSTGRRDASDREEAQTRRRTKKNRHTPPPPPPPAVAPPGGPGMLRRTGARETDDAWRAPRGRGPSAFPEDNNDSSSSSSSFGLFRLGLAGWLAGRPVMILPQVHLRKPCYDFYFL